MRRVGVFAGSRADLWPLVPVLEAAAAEPALEPVLVAGGTVGPRELGEVGARPGVGDLEVVKVPAPAPDDSAVALVAAAARGATALAETLAERPVEMLCLLGDRYETLAAAWAATVLRVPIVHLHGGELTAGAIDDPMRHAITKLAHLHCCAHEVYAARVRRMGEEAWRVHVTGAPGLDRLSADAARTTLEAICEDLGVPLHRPAVLCTYHPTTAHPEVGVAEVEAILDALAEVPTVLITAPGADPGAHVLTERMQQWCARRSGAVLVPSLGARYPAALAGVDVVVGNSSSGIIEAPTLGTPTVNVGARQAGRVRAASVIDVPGDADRVRAAIAAALSPDARVRAAGAMNPYGDGRAGPRVARVMAQAPLDRLIPKGFAEEADA
jgi:UDP-hydrolysing UDP-N-acetyl-D-glucosamine 2-epimerase